MPRLATQFAIALLANAVLASAESIAQPSNRVLQTVDESDRVTLAGTVHPAVLAAGSSAPVDPAFPLEHMILTLRPDPAQQAALDTLVKRQYDAQSSAYHQFLTPDQFSARFGASASDIAKVTNWLAAHGFQIDEVSPNNLAIVFSGNASQVFSAFETEIRQYVVNGEVHHANANDPRIPSAFAGVVGGLVKLHDFHAKPFATGLKTVAQSTSGSAHYLAPADYATIYDLNSLYSGGTTGYGQTIAVLGRSNIKMADVQSFRTEFGLAANNPTVIVAQGADPGFTGNSDALEATLDVEWAGAIAPKANVKFVVAASTSAVDGINLAALYAVNHNVAPVIGVSFGSCESDMAASNVASGNGSELAFYNSLWQQAAVQGISVLVASGDSGAAGCESSLTSTGSKRAVNGICSSPYSTCVGGTEFVEGGNPGQYWLPGNNGVMGSAQSYIPETSWNESALNGGSGLAAGGGGASILWPKPSWQAGAGVPNDGYRDVPDVSLAAASHDGYLIYYNGSRASVGGTSAAAPSFASLMALVTQKNGGAQGNINPVLYPLASRQAAGGAAVFHDIISGNNTVPGVIGYSAGSGYDQATGLGSVDGGLLVNHWRDGVVSGGFSLSATPTTMQIQQGQNGSATLSVAVGAGFSEPVGLAVSGAPAGVTASLSLKIFAAPGSGTSLLTLEVSDTAAPGAYPITITATGKAQTQTATISLTITAIPLNCTLAANPASLSMGLGAATNVTFTCPNQQGKFPSALTMAVSGQPAGVTAAFSTASLTPGTGSTTLTVITTAGASAGSSTLTVTASATGFSKTLNLPLTLTVPGTFTVATSTSAVGMTQSASSVIQIASLHKGSFNSPISFSVTGLPFGATAALAPITVAAPGDGSTTLTLQTAGTTPPGVYSAVLIGAGGNLKVTVPIRMTVTALPAFNFTADQSAPLIRQGTAAATINLAVSGLSAGFNSAVTFAALNLPAGVTAAFSVPSIAAPGAGGSVLSLTASSTATIGQATVSITAAGGGVTKTINLLLTVTPPPSFTLQLPITSYNMIRGAAFSEPITILAQYGFNSPVTLSAGTLPTGLTVGFSSTTINGANGSTIMTITSGASLPAGNYSISVMGTPPAAASGAAAAAQTATLRLLMGTISSTLGASSISMARSASASTSIITTSNNYTGNVALSVSGLPAGVNYQMTPATLPGSGTSALIITAGSSAKPGTYSTSVRTTAGGYATVNALMLTIE